MIGVDSLVASAERDAAEWDETGLPDEVVHAAARSGITMRGGSATELGSTAERLGAVCTSLRSLLTVQEMVAAAVEKWGTAAQRERWLSALDTGELIAGFAATESGAGTDLGAVATTFDRSGPDLCLSGHKRWVTFGQVADVMLVLGRSADGLTTALVDTSWQGVTVQPVHGQLGMRGTRIGHVVFEDVLVPSDRMLAPGGFGLSHVAATALDHGRYTVAWGCVGMAQTCVGDAAAHALTRVHGSGVLSDLDSVRGELGRSAADVVAARALCERAAQARDARDPTAILATLIAKYAAAAAAASVSFRAVQLLGSAGCAPDSRVGRFFRDAKVMQIIEGPAAVAEVQIGDHVLAGGVP